MTYSSTDATDQRKAKLLAPSSATRCSEDNKLDKTGKNTLQPTASSQQPQHHTKNKRHQNHRLRLVRWSVVLTTESTGGGGGGGWGAGAGGREGFKC